MADPSQYGMVPLDKLGLDDATLEMLKSHRVKGGRKVGGNEFRVLISEG